MPLDLPTLFAVSTCITGLLGLFLLLLWVRDRAVRGLGWWGAAYLAGAFAVGLWLAESFLPESMPNEVASAILFLACGMIWSGARAFHGRAARPLVFSAGAVIWLVLFQSPLAPEWNGARILLSSLIIASYAVLTAVELKRERRKSGQARVHAIVVPILHGAIFLSPILAMDLAPDAGEALRGSYFGVFALLTLLYVVGTAFIVVVMANEHVLSLHREAAATDPLTGIFNRRGFLQAAQLLIKKRARWHGAVTMLMFDLDHFKSINDRFGHKIGDDALRVFAQTARANIRTGDILGRLGGEEFAAILPGGIEAGVAVAERLRTSFQAAGVEISGHAIGATVSIGAACGQVAASEDGVAALLAQADAALYRAKAEGRNRTLAAEPMPDRAVSAAKIKRSGKQMAPASAAA